MTLRLIVIRHAKSDWEAGIEVDHARPLNDRGRRDAPRIGRWLAGQGHVPGLILCSDAVRTRQTAALIVAELPAACELRTRPDLYMATAGRLLEVVQTAAEGPVVAVVAHNPGIGLFARGLLRRHPAHERFRDYPTAATTVIDFDLTEWRDLRPGLGRCVDFVIPADLPA